MLSSISSVRQRIENFSGDAGSDISSSWDPASRLPSSKGRDFSSSNQEAARRTAVKWESAVRVAVSEKMRSCAVPAIRIRTSEEDRSNSIRLNPCCLILVIPAEDTSQTCAKPERRKSSGGKSGRRQLRCQLLLRKARVDDYRLTTRVDDEIIFFALLTIFGNMLILYPPSGNNVRSIKAA
jgi:hypothetical protein